MIREITLQNYKGFGASTVVPLEPITVLVGANNSGKSNFISVGRFLSRSPPGELLETGLFNEIFGPTTAR